MKKMMRKYGGVIFFYTAIIIMIWAINYRFERLQETGPQEIAYLSEN